MAFLQQWRRFNFFDKEVVKNPESSEIFNKLQDIDITTCASGRGQIVFGDTKGMLYSLDRSMQLIEFKAYEEKVTHLHQLKQHNILVSIGQDESGVNPVIKVWNLEKKDKMNNPTCTRYTRAIPGSNNPSQVSTLTVSENLNMMAIGFMDGSVTLIRGDVTRERHSKSRTIHQDKTPVTGLAFRHSQRSTFLFVVTETCTLSFNLTGKEARKEVLDLHGCPFHCSVMSDATQDNQFLIGRSDAVYFYQPDGRGPCLAFEGQKTILHWFRGYLVVVTKDSKTLPRSVPGEGPPRIMDIVTVYDIQNKFIAYSAPVPEVLDVIQEWGSIYILGGDRKLYHLQEKDTQTKLEILFKKNLYIPAINLAKSQHYDYDGLIDIFTQYGDHLYSKGDHDGAIAQYIRTIGRLEPSYVIRKFLDAQRIHNLTAYLQALHKETLANEDHTTLLLNCYTKLKDNNKLNEFIRTKDKEVTFDVETAIKVCRQAGYYELSLFLAEKHHQHNLYLKIQLEDIKDYQKALTYIAKLEFEEAMDNMKKYGKILMSEEPSQTTELIKKLCTDYKPSDSQTAPTNEETSSGLDIRPRIKEDDADEKEQKEEEPLVDQASLTGDIIIQLTQKAPPEEFIHIFVNNSSQLMGFLEHMTKVQQDSPSIIYNTLLELYLHDLAHVDHEQKSTKKDLERKAMDLLQTSDVWFLEEHYTQMLQYFAHVDHEQNSTPKQWEPKAMDLLQTIDSHYDIDQALILCQMHNFKKGILFLYEKGKLYQQILHYHMEHDEYDQIIEACKRYGTQDSNLWVQALSYFAGREDNCKQYIVEVLSQIDRRNLLPPLIVIQTLAHNSTATLSVVKDYIIRRLQQENDQIADDERLIKQYREETEKMRTQIDEMKTSAKIFQVSKCSVCNHKLELPSVHFLCQHSYHQHCFESYADNDQECPACAPENHKVLDIIKAQEQGRDLHEQFHRQLEKSQDGFSVVAEYFGRGVFNKVTLLTDSFKSPARQPQPSRQAASSQPSRPVPSQQASQPPPTRQSPASQPRVTQAQPQPTQGSYNPPTRAAQQVPTRAAQPAPPQKRAPVSSMQRPPTPESSKSSPRRTPTSTPQSSLPGTPQRGVSPKPDYNDSLNPFGDDGAPKGKGAPTKPATGGDNTLNPFTGRPYSPTVPANPFEESPPPGSNPFGEEEEEEDDGSYNPFD